MNIRLVNDNDIPSIAKIHIDNWKSIYQESFPAEYLAGLTYNDAIKEWIKFLKQENAFIYIAASDDDSVCGFVACKLDTQTPCSGKLDSLHVNHFQSMQITSMTLWAVETNEHAISIYKHLGAKVHKNEMRYFDWVPVRQLGLIWNDISCLCKTNY